MFVLILLGLILLIAILAIGFAVGSRNGLLPAPNQSSLNGRRNQKTLVSPNNATRTKRQTITLSQTIIKTTASSNGIRSAQSSATVIQPPTRKPIVVKPNNSDATVTPNTVASLLVTPIVPTIVTPRREVVIEPQKVLTVTPSNVPAVIVSPAQTFTVEPPPRGAWEERGWTRQNGNGRETYEGLYILGNRRFNGRIEARNHGRNVTAYIYNPPPEIKRHAHGACFQQVGNGWFLLHWARPARTVDDALLYMERVLDESLNG